MTSPAPTSIPAAIAYQAAAPVEESILAEKPAALTPAFWRLVRTRRSIRRYLPQPVEQETVLAVLEAARWAASAHNRQPWRFCVVTTPAAKQELSGLLSER